MPSRRANFLEGFLKNERTSLMTKSEILSPQRVLDLYYLDTRWHLLEIAAMLDRADRGAVAHQDAPSLETDLRMQLLREAIQILATPSFQGNRTERLLEIFSRLDAKNQQEGGVSC